MSKYQKIIRKYLFLEENHEVGFSAGINRYGKVGIGFLTQRKVRKKIDRHEIYRKRTKSMGMCLFCGDIDWKHLEEHHVDKEKIPNLTITLCANCHRDLHYLNGSIKGI